MKRPRYVQGELSLPGAEAPILLGERVLTYARCPCGQAIVSCRVLCDRCEKEKKDGTTNNQ